MNMLATNINDTASSPSAEGAQTSTPGFDWDVYSQLYEDLRSLKNESEGYAHWIRYGQKEGRVASLAGILEKCGLTQSTFPRHFDWKGYLELNLDLQNSLQNRWQATFHYCQFGIREGRQFLVSRSPSASKMNDPVKDNPVENIAAEGDSKKQEDVDVDDFDWRFYLWYNSDLENISSEQAAREHWEQQGKASGRLSSANLFYNQQGVDAEKLPADFNPQEYLALHPVLVEEGISSKWHVISHFLNHPNFEQELYSFKKLGITLLSDGKYRESVEAFEKAIKFSRDDLDVHTNLAKALALHKDWKRAASVYRKVVQSGKLTGWSLYEFNRSLLQLIKGQVEKTVTSSKSAALSLLDHTEIYQKSLKRGNSKIYGDDWQNFREHVDLLLEKQMSVNIELSSLKQAHQAIDATFDFADFIAFSSYVSPVVSVIIPVYNKIDYTVRCLKSLVKTLSHDFPIEVIVVNDCSSDETKEYLEEIEGLILVNNVNNLGFIHSCNAGAQAASGQYLYFLNNDTELLPNTIESLVEVFDSNDKVGAVGSKLVYPSGALQEAGGIIWQDSSGWNYGRNENPHDPKYNFMRSVDYCSGASLLIKRETFDALDGFEKDFAPAYYEDTDICFAVRHQLGLEVIYQPKSVIIHYEGISSGTSTASGIKRYQVINAKKFKTKWAEALKTHPVNEKGYEDAHKAARRFQGQKTVLVVDSYLPFYDKESGSRRLFQILKIFKALNFHVIFLPDDMQAIEPYTSELQAMQIEVLYTCDGFGMLPEDQLREKLPLIDIAWVCRPGLMQRYLPVIREMPQIKVIYDTIDLHYVRMKREIELGLASEADQKSMSWIDMQALELKMAMKAELTLTVTPTEKDVLQRQGIDAVEVVPNIHFPYEGESPSFDERSGILFIGGYNHPPNVDAVEWLCNEIMPTVWAQIPEINVTLLGSSPSSKVKALESEKVSVTGYVTDVTPYFLNSRVFVAPLRYGAGMKGKIGQSLEYALPLISTSIGVEGMNLTSGKDSIEANTAEEFAQAIIRLYTERESWEHISQESSQAIARYSPQAVEKIIANIVS